jgi:methylated-DNA-[protein]-cysteine S-methyltransferase
MKFEERVWELLKKIPRGRVTTYRLLAKEMNSKAYRAVGSACHKNNNPNAPCYRVVRGDGTIGICHLDSCHKSIIRRLKKDGIKIKGNRILNFDEVLFKF